MNPTPRLRRRMCGVGFQFVLGAVPLVRPSALAGPGERGGRARTKGTAQDLEPAHGGAEPAPHIRRQSRSVDEWFVGEAWEKRPQFLLRFFPSKVDPRVGSGSRVFAILHPMKRPLNLSGPWSKHGWFGLSTGRCGHSLLSDRQLRQQRRWLVSPGIAASSP